VKVAAGTQAGAANAWSVREVNGRDYPDFDPTREIVKSHDLAGNVSVEARY